MRNKHSHRYLINLIRNQPFQLFDYWLKQQKGPASLVKGNVVLIIKVLRVRRARTVTVEISIGVLNRMNDITCRCGHKTLPISD